MKNVARTALAALTAIISTTSHAQISISSSDAPPAYLDIINRARSVQVHYGASEHTKLFNIITQKNDIPNLLSSCRMMPVVVTGDDPITHTPRPVNVMSYAPEGSFVGNLRTIILMPPTGGENSLDDSYADYLCRQGFRVVLVQHWTGDMIAELDMDMHDRGAMRATAAVEDVVEFIHPKKPEQLGILGTSVGAISSALMLGVDDRISAGALIVAGGDMPDVISKSSEATLSRLRTERMEKFGFKDQADYKRALTEHIKIEPLTFAPRARTKKILFFEALKDITVPTMDQRKLYEAFGSQELVTYDADHIHTIIHTSWTESARIATFFKANLSEPTASEVAAMK